MRARSLGARSFKVGMPPKKTDLGGENSVWKVEEIKKLPDADKARAALLLVKEHADNLLRARGWRVKRLIEICCCERKNMGSNLGVVGWCRADGTGTGAAVIALRLRRPKTHELLPLEHNLAVMIHEMSHIVHGNHSANFYALMDELKKQYGLIREKGQLVDLDGFPIAGGRTADAARHDPKSKAEGRAAGLVAAESRARRARRDTGAAGKKLGGGGGGGKGAWAGLAPRDAAARAAERRAADAANGLGDAELSVAAARPGDASAPGAAISWDGNWRAVCPVCGPVCADQRAHAEVLSDDEEEDAVAAESVPVDLRSPDPPEPPPPKRTRIAPASIDLTGDDSDGEAPPAVAGWECACCTLANAAGAAACAACGAARGAAVVDTSRDAALAARLAAADTSRDAQLAASLAAADPAVSAPAPPDAPPAAAVPFDPCKPSLNGGSLARRKPP